VGMDMDNKTGKYKFEKPKKEPSKYPENIESSDLLKMFK
jgi:hypothetical protein